jgi:phosphoglycolate phosphatase
VGPALATAFSALLETSDTARVDHAIVAFRDRFERVGMFENALYPGIAAAVSELAEMGLTLCSVTAKPHVYATRILQHFGLPDRFSGVYGPELTDRTYSTEALIRHACAAERWSLARSSWSGTASRTYGAQRPMDFEPWLHYGAMEITLN